MPQLVAWQTWTPRECAILRRHFSSATQQELIRLLPDRPWRRIKAKAYLLGLRRIVFSRKWTPRELAVLRKHYPIATKYAILSLLPERTAAAIQLQASKLGVYRTR